MVDLEVVGRHALLFDDDAMAAFVNSTDALVQWNSLLIDRYDVRHLLHDVSPPAKKRRTPLLEPDGISRSDLDRERFQDLPPNDDEENPLSETNRQDLAASGTYQAVSFSYGNNDASSETKNSYPGLASSGFHPSFPVPESLLENLPPNEKVHQIIARTAKFVREHGGQSEIVLRVKQGDNPTFGFLMPDHHLHAYFRFLVDHPELLKIETDGKPSEEEKTVESGKNQAHVAGEALTLLGSVYGSVEDEDATPHVASETKEVEISNSVNAVNITSSRGPDWAESSVDLAEVVEVSVNHSSAAAISEKASLAKRGSCATSVSFGTTRDKKREAETSSSPAGSEDRPEFNSKLNMSDIEPPIVEPPPYLKRMIDQTVEFIQRNGKEFEAVLIKQDTSQGKFQFLLPSNHYHPYYLKALQKAQESKLLGKSVAPQKLDLHGHKTVKEKVQDRRGLKDEDKAPSKGFTSCVPNISTKSQEACESERKDKFKMVIGGSKKDNVDKHSKPARHQVGLSVDEVAAIVQAATRGGGSKKDNVDQHSKPVRRQGGLSVDETTAIVLAATRGHGNPKVDSPLEASFNNDSGTGRIGEGGHTSGTGSLSFSRHAHSSLSKPLSHGEQGLLKSVELPESVQQSEKSGKNSDVSVAKAIAKTLALAAACEADSSEAGLTREQKQKAERLKRARMFAAMMKGGGHPRSESLPQLSVQAPDSTPSGLMESGGKFPASADSVPVPAAATASNGLSSGSGDHVSREREGSSVPIDVSVSYKMERKTHSDDDESKDRERRSRKKHSSRSRRHGDSDKDHKHSRKRHRSEHSSHHGKDDHKHRKSHSSHKDKEHRHRHRHRHRSSSEDELEQTRSDKHRRSHPERELEEGEVDEMVSDHSESKEVEGKARKAANDLREGSVPSFADNQSSDATEVPDELRAKVRAMLLATM